MRKTHKLLIVALTALALVACSGTSGSSQPSSHGSQPASGGSNPATSSDGGTSSGQTPDKRIVEDIRIKTLPKTIYILGEEFSIEGGVLELMYEGGGTSELPFTDPMVTVTPPNMTTLGTKSVTVDYDGFIATYQITVKNATVFVTFDLNYENAPTLDPVEIEKGDYVGRPVDPVRTDYRFLSWCTDREGENEFDFTETVINADTTLYASWVMEISVQFDLNDGSAPKKVLVSLNETISVHEAPSVLREGYQFLGWYNGANRYDFKTVITSSLVLTAKWEAIPQGVAARRFTIDYNAGESILPIAYYVADGATTFVPDDPVIEGKEFLGWFKAASGSEVFDFTTPISVDTTIYAHYRVDFYTVNFKYVANGAETVFRSKEVNPGEKVTTVTQKPRVDGYQFDGKWYSDKACTTLFDFDTVIDQDYDLYTKALKRNIFEAEYTYIDPEKVGVGSSNGFTGLACIFEDNGTADASNGYWVGGLYNNGAFVEFVIHSEKEVHDAILQANFSSEYVNMYIAPETTNYPAPQQNYKGFEIATWQAELDESGSPKKDAKGYVQYDESTKTTVNYDPIALEDAIPAEISFYDKRPFETFTLTAKFVLYEGLNVVRMTVRNTDNSGDGTMAAMAPMIDCMMIWTDSELSWSPREDNIADWHNLSVDPSMHEE